MKILTQTLFLFSIIGLRGWGQEANDPSGNPSKSFAIPSLDDSQREAFAQYLRALFPDGEAPEGAQMFTAIFSGSQMGAGEGWFKRSESKYTFDWLVENFGKKAEDGSNVLILAKENFANHLDLFDVLDRNRDGQIQPFDLDWSDSNPYVEMTYMLGRVFRRMDPKGKGIITEDDWLSFFREQSQDGTKLTTEEFTRGIMSGFSAGFMPGDAPNPEVLLKGFFSGEIGSMYEGPSVGDRAPLFELRKVKSEETIRLKSLLGDKPIVLVLGNFTCGPFRSYYPAVERLFEKYGDRAHFVMVYVREAHPDDGWKMQSNTRVGVSVVQPTSFEDRDKVAGQFCERLDPKIPVVVDEVNDPTGHAYSGMPARLYVIAPDGKVVYKSGRGPFGFKPPELEQALAMSLLEHERHLPKNAKEISTNTPTRDAIDQEINDQEIWNLLPPVVERDASHLPNWAIVMAHTLPKTTAALLELDYAHRTKNPIDAKLRAKLRYWIAFLNRCEYSKQAALSDFVRAGGKQKELDTLTDDESTWGMEDCDELQFIKLHTMDAPRIEDSLFHKLLTKHGAKNVAAMVLLGAYGNFQDRLLLGLNIPMEGREALHPLSVKFEPSTFQTQPLIPKSNDFKESKGLGRDLGFREPDWSTVTYEELTKRLEHQKHRVQRLPTPSWDEVASKLPAGFVTRPTRIVWNLVCMGYIPELAIPWSVTTRTMWAEAPQDRVMEESLFWIQTRAVNCNYCMGHCEMLLEVAGLDEAQIANRIRSLASDDWSDFSEAEQRTFQYARKLTSTPWLLTQSEYEQLEQDLGKTEAMATFFWLCRGLYMTRVSDGFQLQLESDNVFADYAKSQK
ncbi:deiodinase family protein [Pirellulaceae bacterium SH449]